MNKFKQTNDRTFTNNLLKVECFNGNAEYLNLFLVTFGGW